MPVSQLHRQIAAIALRVAARHGFALAGGNALMTHGMIDRYTEDVDLFTDQPSGVEDAAGAVEAVLRDAGFDVDRPDQTGGLSDIFYGMGQGLAEWQVTAPDGRQTVLQMSYFDRTCGPVTTDIGPVLDLRDVLGSKVAALASRIEPRDYIDTAAALRRYSPDQLIALAKRLDPGLTDRDFADAARQLDQIPDEAFARYGLGPREVATLRGRFAAWPRH
jgi:predicted nucleotidyltransferase component of viral defense system